jgi:hypothetical protein
VPASLTLRFQRGARLRAGPLLTVFIAGGVESAPGAQIFEVSSVPVLVSSLNGSAFMSSVRTSAPHHLHACNRVFLSFASPSALAAAHGGGWGVFDVLNTTSFSFVGRERAWTAGGPTSVQVTRHGQ